MERNIEKGRGVFTKSSRTIGIDITGDSVREFESEDRGESERG